jgi:flagellar assembly factor FliW
MKAQTTRFGTIDVTEEEVIVLPEGMLGFSDCSQFTLITDELGEPFEWMQSLEQPGLAFVVIEPSRILTEYHFSVKKDQIKALQTDKVEDLLVYVIVTMAGSILDVTVNLQGPIVVNKHTRVGQQIVLNDPKFSTRHPLFTDEPEDAKEWSEAVKKENKVASMRVAIAG